MLTQTCSKQMHFAHKTKRQVCNRPGERGNHINDAQHLVPYAQVIGERGGRGGGKGADGYTSADANKGEVIMPTSCSMC